MLCGDFFQLPPVPEKSHGRIQPAVYSFDAKTWSKCISRPIFLQKVFRQKDSGEFFGLFSKPTKQTKIVAVFVDILTNMRHGSLTDTDEAILGSLSRPLVYPDGIEPTQLYIVFHVTILALL